MLGAFPDDAIYSTRQSRWALHFSACKSASCGDQYRCNDDVGAAASIGRLYPSVCALSTFDKLGYQNFLIKISRDIPVYYWKNQAIWGYPGLTCDLQRVGAGEARTEWTYSSWRDLNLALEDNLVFNLPRQRRPRTWRRQNLMQAGQVGQYVSKPWNPWSPSFLVSSTAIFLFLQDQ